MVLALTFTINYDPDTLYHKDSGSDPLKREGRGEKPNRAVFLNIFGSLLPFIIAK